MLRPAAHLRQQVRPPDHLVDRPRPDARQHLAHLLRIEAHQVHDLVRRPGELRPQRRVLRADPDRAGVALALPHHDAAHRDQRRRADPELLRPEHRRDDDVPPGPQAPVGPQDHPVAQVVRPSAPDAPRESPISHGSPANLIEVTGDAPVPPLCPEIRITSALAFATPAAIVPTPDWLHQLHADLRPRVDLLQVVDQLRQILDRVDVVVRRRRDQRHPRRRMPELARSARSP